MIYKVVFDTSAVVFNWLIPAIGIAALFLGAIGFSVERYVYRRRLTPRLWCYLVLPVIWTLLTVGTECWQYGKLRKAIEDHQYSVVAGRVTNFMAMPYRGHMNESFTVNEHTFSYSDYDLFSLGFHQSSSHGGHQSMKGFVFASDMSIMSL
jgi:hypothetical protein